MRARGFHPNKIIPQIITNTFQPTFDTLSTQPIYKSTFKLKRALFVVVVNLKP
jgi:hypothetical protein